MFSGNNDKMYAFIDESGNIQENILVLCGVVTSDLQSLEKKMIKSERKNAKNKNNEEIKASKQSFSTRKRILSDLIDSDFELYSITFDLNFIKNKPYEFEEIYHFGMGLLCKEIFQDYQEIEFVIDKRYTNNNLRKKLDNSIIKMLATKNQNNFVINIHHEDSLSNALLRIADFSAYELFQIYKNNSNLNEIIQKKVRKNIIYVNTSWNKIKKESKTP